MFTQFYMLIADGRRPHERPSPRCPPSDPVLVLSTPGCDRVEGMHRPSLPSVHQGSALGQSRKRQGLKKRKMTSSDVLDDITNTSDSDNSDEEIDASMKDKRRRLEHKGSGKLLTSLIQSDRGHAPGQTGVRVRTGNTQSRPTQSLGQDMDMYAGYLWIDSLEQNLLYRICRSHCWTDHMNPLRCENTTTANTGIILGMGSANERRRYIVNIFIDWVHTQTDP